MASGRREPGIEGAKVKILTNKKGQPRKRLPKEALPDSDATDLQEQSAIYLRLRNEAMDAKNKREQLLLARDRGLVVEKRLVNLQIEYLLTAMRQKLLAIDGKVLLALKRKPDSTPHETAQVVRTLVLEALNAIADLPHAADPNWLERLSDEDQA